MTRTKSEQISGTDKYLFIEQGLRRGISSEGNNKYMKSYDPTKPLKYITCLDKNNFHGSGMSQYLPHGEFKWLTQEKIEKFDVNSIGEMRPIGYILDVNLKYSDELHELQNDHPLAPEKLAVSYDMLSNYCNKAAGKWNKDWWC